MENAVNERLKILRKSLNLSQKEFAEKLGIKQGSYSALETGSSKITNSSLLLLVNTYNVNTNWLLYGDGEMFLQSKNNFDSIKTDLIKFQGIVIGKFGEKVWKELEPYYPKFSGAKRA